MMDAAAEQMTAELADELASNERRLVDPRSVPVRFHHMKAMGQSAQHCFAAFQEPDSKHTLALRIGKGTHATLFRNQPVKRWDGKVRNGKVWDAFKELHAGSVILNRREHARAESIANAVRNHAEANALLFADGVWVEKSIDWVQLGRHRRSTPDVFSEDYVVELKTTKCAQPARFCRDAMYRGYHAQLADQMEAIHHWTGKRPAKAYIVAVETEPPFAVTVLELTERAIEKGAALCRGWLERLLVCESAGHWPAYCEAVEMFDVPDDEIDLVFADDTDSTEPA